MIKPDGDNMVFLHSTPRAGSTLLSAMLGQHTQVLCPNEPWLMLPLLAVYDHDPLAQTRFNQKVATQAVKELLSEEEFLAAARVFVVEAYNGMLQRAGKSIFVDKTPRYYHILPLLDRLFPRAKRIWLQRNPLDVAASCMTTWNRSIGELVGERVTPYSFDLTLSFRNFSRFFHGQPNTFELRYEDLVAEPQRCLQDLCLFLGIKPERGLEQYGQDNRQIDSLRSKTMGDRNLFDHSEPHRRSIGQWKKVLGSDDVQRLLDGIGCAPFERMGYHETIQSLKEDGYTMPSSADVEGRLDQLEQGAAVRTTDGTHVLPPEEAQRLLKQLRRHWWIRLGRKLGLFRFSST